MDTRAVAQQAGLVHKWLTFRNPDAPLLRGDDGNFYSTSAGGGSEEKGVLFCLTEDGRFNAQVTFGVDTTLTAPRGLIRTKDGSFCGIANQGGTYGAGGIFKYSASGNFTVLKEFGATNLIYPTGRLTEDAAGNLYGVASTDRNDLRKVAIFRLSANGVLTTFADFPSLDIRPNTSFLVQQDGSILGTTGRGGTSNVGTLFRVSPEGAFSVLLNFSSTTGSGPSGDLIQAADGSIYGTNFSGGTGNGGNVFRYSFVTGYTIVKQFAFVSSVSSPAGGLIRGDDSLLYGIATRGGSNGTGVVYRLDPSNGNLESLVSFPTGTSVPSGIVTFSSPSELLAAAKDSSTDGVGYLARVDLGPTPSLTVLRADNEQGAGNIPTVTLLSDGSVAGVTERGGKFDLGTVFRVTPSGEQTVLHHFDGQNGTSPTFPLTLGKDGLLYGVTATGGTNNTGVLFRISVLGSYEKLADFTGPNGKTPSSPVAEAPDGAFYGVTLAGGFDDAGMVYKWTAAGGVTQRCAAATGGGFKNYPQLSGPIAILPDGTIFGTYLLPSDRAGRVFRLPPDGMLVAYYASAPPLGLTSPILNGLSLGSDGFLYATTSKAANFDSTGDVYRISTVPGEFGTGTVTLLARFPNTAGNGSEPKAPPLLAPDGTIFGTTSRIVTTPASDQGLVWAITPAGTLRTVYSFAGLRWPFRMASQPIRSTTGDLLIAGREGLFRIQPSAPSVTTQTTENLTRTSATLRGTLVNAGAGDASVFFEREDAPGEANYITASPSTAERYTSGLAIQAEVSGLTPHTSYRVRAVARNLLGASIGEYVSFTTANAAPVPQNDSVHFGIGSGPLVKLLSNDADNDGDSLHITGVTDGSHVKTSVDQSGDVVLSPGAGFDGNDSFTYTVTDGFGGTSQATVSLTNAIPTANQDIIVADGLAGGTFSAGDLVANDLDADGDSLAVLEVSSGAFGAVEIEGDHFRYTPSESFAGQDLLTYKITDGHGGTAAGTIDVRIQAPFLRGLAATGSVIGTGGAALTSRTFGLPSINNSGQIAFATTGRTTAGTRSAIVSGLPLQVIAIAGADADGGGKFARFSDPVLSASGAVAFRANLAGVAKANDTAVFSNASGSLAKVLGKGDLAPGIPNGRIASVDAIALTDEGRLLVVAKLFAGAGGASRSSDEVLLRQSGTGDFELVLREGQKFSLSVGERTAKSFSALKPSPGSPDARRCFNAAGDLFVKVTFREGGDGVFCIPHGDTTPIPLLLTASLDPESHLLSIPGNPAVDDSGAVIVRVALPSANGKKAAGVEKILLIPAEGEVETIAQTGSGPGEFASFQDPLISRDGIVTFAAVLASKKGEITAQNSSGIWERRPGGELTEVARKSDQPIDAPGEKFTSFSSLISQRNRGAAFIGEMTTTSPGGRAAKSATLWSRSEDGGLHLLVKVGDQPEGGDHAIRSIAVLGAVPGSFGQGHSWNDAGAFICRVAYTDGTYGVIKVFAPR